MRFAYTVIPTSASSSDVRPAGYPSAYASETHAVTSAFGLVVVRAKQFNRNHKEMYKEIRDSVENRLWSRKIMFWNEEERGIQKTRLVSTVIYSSLRGAFTIQFPVEDCEYAEQLLLA